MRKGFAQLVLTEKIVVVFNLCCAFGIMLLFSLIEAMLIRIIVAIIFCLGLYFSLFVLIALSKSKLFVLWRLLLILVWMLVMTAIAIYLSFIFAYLSHPAVFSVMRLLQAVHGGIYAIAFGLIATFIFWIPLFIVNSMLLLIPKRHKTT